MAKTGYFVGNDAGHIVTPCERRVKAKHRKNKGKLYDTDGIIVLYMYLTKIYMG